MSTSRATLFAFVDVWHRNRQVSGLQQSLLRECLNGRSHELIGRSVTDSPVLHYCAHCRGKLSTCAIWQQFDLAIWGEGKANPKARWATSASPAAGLRSQYANLASAQTSPFVARL